MKDDNRPLMVSIRCITYNHEPYIRQCLDGIVMQQTIFRFEVIVHDDASTDGTGSIIKEYAEKYPEIIKPIFETENKWSKRDGSLQRIMNEACQGKYIAICEGDDYWIDYQYLQKKIDILESDDGISMVCNKTACFSQKQKCIVRYNLDFHNDRFLDPKDLIMRGGGYVATCSMVYRKSVVDNYPDYCVKCHVGDYPRQIMCGMKGKVYFLSDTMTVYRVDNSNSWVGKNWGNLSWDNLQSEIDLLSGFSHDFPSFYKTFQLRKRRFILQHVPNRKEERSLYKEYKIRFDDIIRTFGFKEKILFYINSSSKKELIYRCINKFIAWKNV